ncbi:hypothetical protein BACSP_03700 [Bacillus sp. T2.9-1]|nr:hypothetical protein BACSP_03700 [Bacillus sp. T2.9-1]
MKANNKLVWRGVRSTPTGDARKSETLQERERRSGSALAPVSRAVSLGKQKPTLS